MKSAWISKWFRTRAARNMPGHIRWVAMVGLLALMTGCLQLEITIEMQDDGGARVTERLCLSRKLVELDAASPADRKLERWLERPAVDARVREMGKGAVVVDHRVTLLQDGSRESVAVYSIPEIEDLRLVNPYVHDRSPARTMRLKFNPIHKFVNSFERVGDVMMYLVPAGGAAGEPVGGGALTNMTPLDMQVYRELQPVFADLMEGLNVRMDLVAPKSISAGHVRNIRAGAKMLTFLAFSDKDLDAYGSRFVDNEELMLHLLQYNLGADLITDHTQTFAQNATLPVFLGNKPYAVGRFRIHPTKKMFQKYFAGRPKSEGGDQ